MTPSDLVVLTDPGHLCRRSCASDPVIQGLTFSDQTTPDQSIVNNNDDDDNVDVDDNNNNNNNNNNDDEEENHNDVDKS